MIDHAVSQADTDAIIFDVSSPGGSVAGVPELAAKIAACPLKTIASINPLAASGAYWLASQCKECTITPSGECGSIGVYMLQVDQSKMLEELGIKVSVIRAGKNKISNNPYEPFSDEGRAEMQRRVDDTYDMFIRDVATGRGMSMYSVRESYGDGSVFSAQTALSLGMVDKIQPLDSVIGRYGSIQVARSPYASFHIRAHCAKTGCKTHGRQTCHIKAKRGF